MFKNKTDRMVKNGNYETKLLISICTFILSVRYFFFSGTEKQLTNQSEKETNMIGGIYSMMRSVPIGAQFFKVDIP